MSDFGPQYGAESKPPYDAPGERRGMSGCLKAFIIVLVVGVIALLSCCIIGAVYFSRGVTQEPAKVREIAGDIINWEFNNDVEPVFGVNFFFARAVGLADPQKGFILIADSKYMPAEDFGKQMDQSIRGEIDSGDEFEKTVVVEAGERDIVIKGESIAFQFDKTRGRDSDEIYWEVQGVVPGKDNPTFVMLKLRDSAFSEEEIVRRLEAIQ